MREKLVKGNGPFLIAFISLVVIGVVILTNFISFSNIERVITDQIKENQLTETEHAAGRMENHIIQVKDELVTLSKFPLTDSSARSECSDEVRIGEEKVAGKIGSLFRVDMYGNVVECSPTEFADILGLNIRSKDYFAVPKETNEPHVTGARQGSNTQIIISAPLFETLSYTPYPNFVGDFQGILMSIIEMNNLYNLYIHPILNSGRNFYLLFDLETEETIIKSEELNDYSEIKNLFPAADANLNIITDFNGYGKTIITSADLVFDSETWRLVVLAPMESMGTEIKSVQNRHLFSLIFISIVAIVIFISFVTIYKSKEETTFRLKKAHLTLEKLGIQVGVESEKYNRAEIVLESSKMYLVPEDEENHAHELFIGTLNKGFAGLGIVRENPGSFKKRYNLEKTSFIWMSRENIEDVPSETNVHNLYDLISQFIKKCNKGVVLIDRLDYLIRENKLEAVIEKIQALRDLIQSSGSIIILSLNPSLVTDNALKAIEAEAIDVYGKQLKKGIDLPDSEMNILHYINDKNIKNQLASYSDITSQFKITKPTTRVKINKLQGLGLVQVERRGRYKSLRITSAGRRIIG
ncbi:DUF835 domain-containing protein [Candidatus Woesearchaeota archaeon]|nr:DUF835 domain-containing protein [Candidatus Woesearchaeota archaeon]